MDLTTILTDLEHDADNYIQNLSCWGKYISANGFAYVAKAGLYLLLSKKARKEPFAKLFWLPLGLDIISMFTYAPFIKKRKRK